MEVRRGYEARNFAISIKADEIAIYGMAEAATLVMLVNTQGNHAHLLLSQLLWCHWCCFWQIHQFCSQIPLVTPCKSILCGSYCYMFTFFISYEIPGLVSISFLDLLECLEVVFYGSGWKKETIGHSLGIHLYVFGIASCFSCLKNSFMLFCMSHQHQTL